MARSALAVCRIAAYLIFTFLCMPVQWLILRFAPRRNPYAFPRFYHRICLWIFGIRIIVAGQPDQGPNIVYVANHISYLDIPVIASLVKTAFIAKDDVAAWPLFGTLGRLQRTLFVSRNPLDAEKERAAFAARLEECLPLTLFGEGTSTMGDKILPFKSSAFEAFLNRNIKIQPVTLSIQSVNGIPAIHKAEREIFAWGEIDVFPHLFRFSEQKGCVLKVEFHQPVPTGCFENRKSLASYCRDVVAKGLDLSRPSA